ncbi:MAG TPA: ribosome silencing factor [bacterium]|nr:ribosome silencing factor [bacterium]
MDLPLNIRRMVEALEDKKAMDIQVLDVREIVSYADFLVVCSGSSTTQVNAIVDHLSWVFQGKEKPTYQSRSKDNSWWTLDFVDVVIHVFLEETRRFYDLENLWADSRKVAL